MGFAAEYVGQKMVTYADRPWTSDCESPVEITEDGEIRTMNIFYKQLITMLSAHVSIMVLVM